ncbi:hypothetical protein [Thiorhodococcus minor]|uniref:Glycosyltransferase RgtA/B/C/D-like domain-containing protein n=1 Tax=Thiorhodococcus minor TaxID=57489 RepID=A0A6M0JZD3_9GAMM|nr:hypothetical protein [Thiorhodococcus minor]NEV62822.1 hypothetical protein [Thiorhodococcus minor]
MTLPGLACAALIRRFLLKEEPGAWSLALGYGYLVGMLVAASLLRLLAPLGLTVSFWLALLCFLPALAFAIREMLPAKRRLLGLRPAWPLSISRLIGWKPALSILLLAWLAARATILASEVWLQPLFPWDAWTTWAARARVWCELGQLVPFVSANDWLTSSGSGAYTIAAWSYPKTVSLIALWSALAYGGWNDTAANLPWLGCYVALGLGFYGQARRWGADVAPSLVFLWMLLSIPLLNVHVALAGYADIWLSAVFGLSAIALVHWAANGDPRQAVLAAILAAFLPFIKHEGAVWVSLLACAAIVASVRPRWILMAIAGLAGGLGLVLSTGGLALTIPLLGSLELRPDHLRLFALAELDLGFHNSWPATVDNLFIYGNWNLLLYLLVPAIPWGLARLARTGDSPWLRAELALVLSSLAALFVLFFLTDAHRWAERSTSVSRLVLHFTPVYVFYLFSLFCLPRAQIPGPSAAVPDRA